MDCLEFIARVTSHIPDKGQVMVRYYGLYANGAGRNVCRPSDKWAFGGRQERLNLKEIVYTFSGQQKS